ncbi:MAG: hypothetical protein IT338_19155 [Thermomicrobiales bacterium]|nr:hypothetical protein [Thermomicrobiales bacterium]
MSNAHDLPTGGVNAQPAQPSNAAATGNEPVDAAQTGLRAELAAERARRRELEAALARHDAVLHIFAHDLRNPLTGLSLSAQLAQRHVTRGGQVDPRRVERSLQAILGHCADIAALLERLMDGTLHREIDQARVDPGVGGSHYANNDGRSDTSSATNRPENDDR